MSIPAVNKLRLLSKAAPPLPHPGTMSKAKSPTSTSVPETRGAILAIEGSEEDVHVVTEWLAEFLKNENDEFLVRAFLGPDINAVMAGAEGDDDADVVGTTQQRYLKAISEWHWVSQEVVKFITTARKAGDGVLTEGNATNNGQEKAEEQQQQKEKQDEDIDMDSTSSPTSAVSPRTITQTERLSLESNANKSNSAASRAIDTSSATPPRPAATPSPPPQSPKPPNHQKLHIPFHIALLPRYQLSTVDTASLTMPITDSYLPIDHWQWAAALWRGCVGADVTIVVQDERTSNTNAGSADTASGVGSVGSGNGSGAGMSGGSGVEVRLGLGDVKAVIVRKGGNNGGEKKVIEAGALRRVGFEIVEFLRR